jgi:HD-GYP domain-containing protein (c-di-GMP phosphodiesterase class II)
MKSIEALQKTIVIAYGSTFADNPIWPRIRSKLILPKEIKDIASARQIDPAIFMLDLNLLMETSFSEWREAFPDSILLCADSVDVDADLLVNSHLPYRQTSKLLEMACYQWVLKKERIEVQHARTMGTQNLSKLADIGISLSAEDDLMTLLRKILTEGQNIACCDAASLSLIDELANSKKELVFKLTQNDSMEFPFENSRFAVDASSLTGYVALTNRDLNLADAHVLPANSPYKFNKKYDLETGYRTKSVYTIPLTNKHKEVIGVLQFINRKKARSLKIRDEKSANAYTQPFDPDTSIILQALASQAGIAIENTILYNDIKNLFEGFVNASVAAIEQRDPTTSGHSFRVADLCITLAQSVSVSDAYSFRKIKYSDAEIQELKYAALLHDFGKVGVREEVLVKEKKLIPGSLNTINLRIMLAQERLRTQALSRQLEMYRRGSAAESEISLIHKQLLDELEKLERFYSAIVEVNEPTVLAQENRELLQQINQYQLVTEAQELSILTQQEFELLSIPKGSLSFTERKEIESHVVHTQNFLNHIPWTKEFRRIPSIAGAHHEKLDGSGYPYGLKGNEIPVSSKIMTVCDIYDALTAADRPYKKAMSRDSALNILESEAKRSLLDIELVKLFIDAKVFECIDSKVYSSNPTAKYSNHPCDPELHEHKQ